MNTTIQKLKKTFNCQTIDELAKLLGLGRNTLFAYKRGDGGKPTKRFLETIEIIFDHLPDKARKECVALIKKRSKQV